MEKIDLLLELAETAGLYETSEFTTGKLAKKLEVSQQTISNVLRQLELEGLINREPYYLGVKVSLTEQGSYFLNSYKEKLNLLFQNVNAVEGKVFSGLGEGSFYVMQEGYKKQFKEKLGINPFNGTLNLKVETTRIKKFLADKKPLIIEGFKADNRTFGSLRSFPVRINGIKCAIILPDRTHYKEDTLEIISNTYLREKLKLKDDNKVTITGGVIK